MILSKKKLSELTPTVSGKGIDIDEEVNKKITAGKLNELLLIVPTNRKIRYLKKELISLSPNKAAQNINLETIGSFATALFYKDKSAKNKILSDAASAVLLKQSFQEVKLKYFSLYGDEIPFGTLERVKNVISEYKRNGIIPEHIRTEMRKLNESEKLKAEDIANIFEIYQKKCDELKVKEIGDVYKGLIDFNEAKFVGNFRFLYPQVDLVVINGFDEFTTPEIEIIDSLSKINETNLFLSFDYFKFNPLIFSHLENCYKKLLAKGFNEIKDVSKGSYNDFITSVREHLFLEKPDKKINRFKKELTRIPSPTKGKEVEFVAKEIKDLISKRKVEPDNICVVFNLIQEYSPIIRDIFPVYGIPFNLTDRFSLSTSQSIISILNFLEILENDFYYRNIFRSLSGGYLSLEKVDLSNLLRVSINLKIISGLNNWKESLSSVINDYDSQENDPAAAGLLEKESYEKALKNITFLESKLFRFNRMLTITEFYQELENLIFSFEIPSKIINANYQNAEKDIKALTEFLGTIDEMFYLLKLEFSDKEKFPLKFFINNIRTAVSNTRYNIKEKPGYGVQVTTLDEIRHLKFDYVFICGLVDGMLPTRYAPEIFFSGPYVKSEIINQTEQRYRFYQSLCSWNKGLYVTFPKAEESDTFEESNFLKMFANLFDITEKTESDFGNKIYSKEELLISIGKLGIDKFNTLENSTIKDIDLERIKHSLEIENIRLGNPLGDSVFTGSIAEDISDKGKNKLESFKNNHYSISQLETYAKCPYKYFAERVLELEAIEEPTEEIEALEMGSLVHNTFYEFYKRLKEKNIVLAQCSDKDFEYAVNMIFELAEEKIKSLNFNSPLTFYEKEKIFGLSGEKKNSLLHKFLENERENKDGFIPTFFESTFGKLKDEENNHSVLPEFKVDNVNVRGKIDRIDLNNESHKLNVIDYKIGGKKPTNTDLIDGLSLQLPLYMYAASKLIKVQMQYDFEPEDAFIYSLRYDSERFGKMNIKTKYLAKKLEVTEGELINKLIEICKDSIKKYVNLISKGEFNLTKLKDRENKVCNYCGFRSICRIEEVN